MLTPNTTQAPKQGSHMAPQGQESCPGVGLGPRARAGSPRHHQPPLDAHPSHVAQGLERRDNGHLWFFLYFSRGFGFAYF